MIDFQLLFDREGYTQNLLKQARAAFREAIREWLRYVLEHVPVETGMAKGALIPVSRHLRNVSFGIYPTRKPYYSKLEGSIQSIESGMQKSRFVLIESGAEWNFEWDPGVLHYWTSQFYHGPAIPGDELLAMADSVFMTEVERQLKTRYPRLSDYFSFGTG